MSKSLGFAVCALCVAVILGAHVVTRHAGARRRLVGALVGIAVIAAVSALYFTHQIGDRTFATTILLSVVGTTIIDLRSTRRPDNGDRRTT